MEIIVGNKGVEFYAYKIINVMDKKITISCQDSVENIMKTRILIHTILRFIGYKITNSKKSTFKESGKTIKCIIFTIEMEDLFLKRKKKLLKDKEIKEILKLDPKSYCDGAMLFIWSSNIHYLKQLKKGNEDYNIVLARVLSNGRV